jgi:hypothetical protein
MIAMPGGKTNRPATGGIITYEGRLKKRCLISI